MEAENPRELDVAAAVAVAALTDPATTAPLG
jgi:hypothetical protein